MSNTVSDKIDLILFLFITGTVSSTGKDHTPCMSQLETQYIKSLKHHYENATRASVFSICI